MAHHTHARLVCHHTPLWRRKEVVCVCVCVVVVVMVVRWWWGEGEELADTEANSH